MNFDKSKVYTALNADELKVGSQVIVGDNLANLKKYVEYEYISTLEDVKSDTYTARFIANGGVFYYFAYLVSEPEEKKLKWTDLKIGDVIKRKDGKQFAMVTGINKDCMDDFHVYAGCNFLNDDRLAEWEKVEDTKQQDKQQELSFDLD